LFSAFSLGHGVARAVRQKLRGLPERVVVTSFTGTDGVQPATGEAFFDARNERDEKAH
jgi:hypothetical protein